MRLWLRGLIVLLLCLRNPPLLIIDRPNRVLRSYLVLSSQYAIAQVINGVGFPSQKIKSGLPAHFVIGGRVSSASAARRQIKPCKTSGNVA